MSVSFSVGDRVKVASAKYPGVWTVQSMGPKNLTLFQSERGISLTAPRTMVSQLTTEDGQSIDAAALPEFYYPGEVIHLRGGKFEGVYVVISDRGGKTVSVARIGGDKGRYVRAHRGNITRVPASSVQVTL